MGDDDEHLAKHLTSVRLAVRTSALGEEALSLQVLFAHLIIIENCTKLENVFEGKMYAKTYRAIEALTMVVVGQCLYPTITSLDRETTGKALGGEQLVPVGLAIGLTFLQEEWAIAEQLAAVCASETLRMEVFANGVQTVALKLNAFLISTYKHTFSQIKKNQSNSVFLYLYFIFNLICFYL